MKLLYRLKIPLLVILASLLLFFIIRPFLFTNSTAAPLDSDARARNEQSSDTLKRSRVVNTFTGTGEQKDLPPAYNGGETFPGADVPFGMVQWSPDTVSYAYSGYNYKDSRIRGFSLTHLSGAGCSQYGDAPFMPYPGPVTLSPATNADHYISTFSHAKETAYAGYYKVQLDNGVTSELSVTQHSGAGRFNYPAVQPASLLLNLSGSLNQVNDAQASIGSDTISGWINSGNFCYLHHNTYRVYFWAQFSQPFASTGTWSGDTLSNNSTSITGGKSGVFVTFDTSRQQTITARVGLSFVSIANAEANVNQENPTGNFDVVANQATQTWNDWLSKIRVRGGTPEQIATFYTALYHALLFPSVFSDVNGEYPGFDGQIYRVPEGHAQYANFSGWDIYRSEAQLLTLLAPAQASDMAQSLLNNYKQGGILSKWSVANGETYVQVGDPAAAIIADIYAFGGTDFNTREALNAMLNQAIQPNQARPGLGYLDTPGYLPLDGSYGCCNAYGPAATTLEYNTADFALGAFALALGDQENAHKFIERAQNWQHLFNPATGYLQPRYLNGEFASEYPLTSNKGWVEGNSAQYTWMVPFNLRDLFAAMGGNANVVRRLDSFFSRINVGLDQPYAFLGNEPTFEVPWEYNYAGAPYKTQSIVRQIVNTLFANNPSGLPGNDDLGEMSSWYVFAAMGMYPETPGTANLVLASPLFSSITIQRPGGQILQINAPGASTNLYYVQSLKVNGQPSSKAWLPSAFVANGGTLDYVLGRQPDLTWGAAAEDAPPSYN